MLLIIFIFFKEDALSFSQDLQKSTIHNEQKYFEMASHFSNIHTYTLYRKLENMKNAYHAKWISGIVYDKI